MVMNSENFKRDLKLAESVVSFSDLPGRAPEGQIRFVHNLGEAVVHKRGRWVFLVSVALDEGCPLFVGRRPAYRPSSVLAIPDDIDL